MYYVPILERAFFFSKNAPAFWIRQIPLDNFKIHQKNSNSASAFLGHVGEEVKNEYPQSQKK
jgi:hypothetical protein